MFQRFHAMKERREEGFTLIELLVVILIIAILAAIAIPVFLNQRKKGWVAQQESALNAATNMESYSTGNNGTYPWSLAMLQSEGFNPVNGVAVSVVYPTAATPQDGHYCLLADHTQSSVANLYYSSVTGAPSTTVCT